MRKQMVLAVAALFAMTVLSPLVWAQDQSGSDSSQVQPVVGRVSVVRGSVSIQRGDSGDWVAATLNTPLESGDRVSTGDASRVEIQLDYADVVRLDQDSTVKIADLTASHIQLQVGQGLVSYSVFPNSRADAEIDTPNSAVHPLRNGEYRIQVDSDSQTEVTVRSGQAEVSEPQGSTRIESGELITIQGTDNPQYQTGNAAARDGFDRWNEDRDHAIQDAQSWQHDNRYYTGSEDLDHYGHWEYVPDYGQIWVPVQSYGWAPYRDGRWVWQPYYGWTWVSYEPWGWAPYHYGRWFVYGGNWAWWPGPVGVYGGWGYYPVWSPAYVSFFGWGGGVSFGFGFGNIGWLPCGPADYFTPWWGYGVTNVTIINFVDRDGWDRDRFDRDGWGHDRFDRDGRFGRGVGDRDFDRRMDPLFRGRNGFSNINRFGNDARLRAGVSSVRGDQFGRGDARFQRGIGTEQFQKASFMTGKLPAVPDRQSVGRVQERVSPAIARTSAANNQRFFSQSRPTYTPQPFSQQVAEQQSIIEKSRGQAGANDRLGTTPNGRESGSPSFQNNSRVPMNETLRPGVATRDNARTGAQNGAQPFQNNSRAPMNETLRPGVATRDNAHTGEQAGAQARPGWHSFGDNGSSDGQGQDKFQPNRSIQQPRSNQPGNAGPARDSQSRPQTTVRPGWHGFGDNGSGDGQGQGKFQPNRSIQQPRSNQPGNAGPARDSQSRPQTTVRPGWHNFSGNSDSAGARQPEVQQNRSFQQPRDAVQSRPGGWGDNGRQFTQQSPRTENSQPTRPGWNNFSRPSDQGGSYSRPQLDMRQPVVRQRGPSGDSTPHVYGGNYGDDGRPGGNSSRSYSAPRYSAPQSYARPSENYSRPSFGGGDRSYSAPRGNYSQPSFGGSRPSFGGSRPSFGGGRPNGGDGNHGGGGHPNGRPTNRID